MKTILTFFLSLALLTLPVANAQWAAVLAGSPPAAAGYDSDAQAFFTAAGITDTTQKDAVNQLVLDLKAASIWTGMIAIYPFVGGDATKHSYNLRNTATFQITWSGTVTHDSNGITGNGSTGKGDTGLNYSTDTTANSLAYGYYSRTDSLASVADIGAGSGSGSTHIYGRHGNGNAYFRESYPDGDISVSSGNATRLFVVSRTGAASLSGYRDSGTPIVSEADSQGTPDSANFEILYHDTGYSSRNLAFAFIGAGLSDTNVGALVTAVTTFQTALSRNI